MAETGRACELCSLEAVVYCSSDSAFLCRGCDERVHNANFLVARHVRVHVDPLVPSGNMKGAASCSLKVRGEVVDQDGDEDEEDCISSSSSCVSSTGEAEDAEVTVATSSSAASLRRKRIYRRVPALLDTKVEGVLVNWCRMVGVEDGRVVNTTIELLTGCLGKMTVLPFRVSLATAFWVAIRPCTGPTTTCHELRKLEQISGVPAKLIVASEPRIIARVYKRRQSREDHEEGWAEC